MAELEGGEAAVVTASGMAAISSALLSVLSSGDELIATRQTLRRHLPADAGRAAALWHSRASRRGRSRRLRAVRYAANAGALRRDADQSDACGWWTCSRRRLWRTVTNWSP